MVIIIMAGPYMVTWTSVYSILSCDQNEMQDSKCSLNCSLRYVCSRACIKESGKSHYFMQTQDDEGNFTWVELFNSLTKSVYYLKFKHTWPYSFGGKASRRIKPVAHGISTSWKTEACGGFWQAFLE